MVNYMKKEVWVRKENLVRRRKNMSTRRKENDGEKKLSDSISTKEELLLCCGMQKIIFPFGKGRTSGITFQDLS